MAKIRYYYDTETCKYERIHTSPLEYTLTIGGFLVLSCIFGYFFLLFYSQLFDTQKETTLRNENEVLKTNYTLINKKLEDAFSSLKALQNRDNKVYRVVFESEPVQSLSSQKIQTEKYHDLLSQKLENKELIISTHNKLELLCKNMYLQSKSYDEIANLVKDKQKMLVCIPAIRPLKNSDHRSLASGFGYRIHPIYKMKKFHTGLDFTAKSGTPIYATGNGVVRTAGASNTGYGIEIEINHGFGYVSKYAHLSKVKSRVGSKVKRGELIGYVGSTGTSVSAHLHYEIMKNGEKVNPINYFHNDLSPTEYQEMIRQSEIENQSLGGE